MKTFLGVVAALGTVAAQYEAGNGSLPVVDLGYEIYQASGYNVSLFCVVSLGRVLDE